MRYLTCRFYSTCALLLLILLSCIGHCQTSQINENVAAIRPLVFLHDNAGVAHEGAYHFTITTNEQNVRIARLWIARSATPDFQNAKWETVALQDAPELAKIYKLSRKAAVPVGSPAQKYLAVKGEIEIAKADGKMESHFSAVTTLPKVKTWSLKKPDGSRSVYVQPSEKAGQIQLWIARAATRDFQDARWQKLPLTAPENNSVWQNFSANVPASTKDKPYIAVYGEADFAKDSKAGRVVSEKVIWNSLPLPKNATQIQTGNCPLHGTNAGVVPVIYGLPGGGAPKNAVFAGCIVGPGSPIWHCRLCDCDWGDVMKQMAQGSN